MGRPFYRRIFLSRGRSFSVILFCSLCWLPVFSGCEGGDGEQVATDADQEEAMPGVAFVRLNRTSLRTDPVPTASEIEFMPAGSQVRLLRRSTEKHKLGSLENYWYNVRMESGLEGWVFGSNLILETDSSNPAKSVRPVIALSEIGDKLAGKWFETDLTGASGYLKIYFWRDGTYRHGYGLGGMKKGQYELKPTDNVILLEKGSGAGPYLKVQVIGRDVNLVGEKDGYEIWFRRRFDDPDIYEAGIR